MMKTILILLISGLLLGCNKFDDNSPYHDFVGTWTSISLTNEHTIDIKSNGKLLMSNKYERGIKLKVSSIVDEGSYFSFINNKGLNLGFVLNNTKDTLFGTVFDYVENTTLMEEVNGAYYIKK